MSTGSPVLLMVILFAPSLLIVAPSWKAPLIVTALGVSAGIVRLFAVPSSNSMYHPESAVQHYPQLPAVPLFSFSAGFLRTNLTIQSNKTLITSLISEAGLETVISVFPSEHKQYLPDLPKQLQGLRSSPNKVQAD